MTKNSEKSPTSPDDVHFCNQVKKFQNIIKHIDFASLLSSQTVQTLNIMRYSVAFYLSQHCSSMYRCGPGTG